MCFSRVGELPDSVETAECKPDKSCNENPSSAPTSTNGKPPRNWSSESASSGSQTTLDGPLVREGSKSASNDPCARVEANAEDMYQLEFGLDGPSPATESASWRKIASDLSTTSFDCKVDEHHPKSQLGWSGSQLMKAQRWRLMWLVGFHHLAAEFVSRLIRRLTAHRPPFPNLVPALNNPRYPSNTRAPCAEVASDQPVTTIWGIRSRNTSRKRTASSRISGKICVWAEVVKSRTMLA